MWDYCCNQLQSELPEEHFLTWIRPLQAVEDDASLRLLAPNPIVLQQVEQRFMPRIRELVLLGNAHLAVSLGVGSSTPAIINNTLARRAGSPGRGATPGARAAGHPANHHAALGAGFTFDTFIEGKSNEIAKAMSLKAVQSPGSAENNPLLIYGGTGLGKTHLIHAVGHAILKENPAGRVVCRHSEQFVREMVQALQRNTIDNFKNTYRNADTLLIDDIQFFVGKERSQEEFFHTFNRLLESKKQVILTCDRYPKEIEGLEDRLKSRFSWGLSAAVYPPELETRQAILKAKAEQARFYIPDEVALFMAEKIRSNVRDLEGALRRIIAVAEFTGTPINLELTRKALSDLLAVHARQNSIENIQKTVAGYYHIRVSDLTSKSRSRSVARPRQIAMALTKELTNHSLPEIGEAFGGRDHTTVLYACRKIKELMVSDNQVREDYQNLLMTLTT